MIQAGAGGEQSAHRPGDQDRQAKTAEIARKRRVNRLDRLHRRIKRGAEQEEAADQQRQHDQRTHPPANLALPDLHRRDQDRGPQRQRAQEPQPAGVPAFGHRRHRHQHSREAAERHEAHDADVEQSGKAPLQVHAERHDRRDQPHVQDRQRQVPALHEAGEDDQQCHPGIEKIATRSHTDCPLKRPVGLNSSTMIRIAKLTANL